MTQNQLVPKKLGFFPTPLVKLANLGKALGGPSIYMKRDDLTGLAFGGNKTRKLEYLTGDAVARGADSLITAGAAQSNHCRQTAAAAAMLGLECHLMLGGSEPSNFNGNLLLDNLLGSKIHWCGEHRKGEDIPQLVDSLSAQGKKPYVIPYGGSNDLGAMGFVNAMLELSEQCGSQRPAFSHIVFASSSGGTHAGIMTGNAELKLTDKVVGINIDKDESDELPFEQRIVEIANKTAKLLESKTEFSEKDVILNSEFVGAGYGIVGDLEKEAIRLTAGHEGILLDPVYTGRAMGGLIQMIRSGEIGQSDRVLFWHTGGSPALFAYAETLTD